ncbi:hypothetical protein SUNI508_00632 [Seiridium unicorne]|uniref:Uncharacterized protein n=1 Tax=Seiridium unicorne TaxID=138068 RepID=A0ABR2V7G2_9PEZI
MTSSLLTQRASASDADEIVEFHKKVLGEKYHDPVPDTQNHASQVKNLITANQVIVNILRAGGDIIALAQWGVNMGNDPHYTTAAGTETNARGELYGVRNVSAAGESLRSTAFGTVRRGEPTSTFFNPIIAAWNDERTAEENERDSTNHIRPHIGTALTCEALVSPSHKREGSQWLAEQFVAMGERLLDHADTKIIYIHRHGTFPGFADLGMGERFRQIRARGIQAMDTGLEYLVYKDERGEVVDVEKSAFYRLYEFLRS